MVGRMIFVTYSLGLIQFSPVLSDNSDRINLALNKPASQSTTGHGGVAENAVDGDRNPDYWGWSCTHTDDGPSNWWMVDLEQDAIVYEVLIASRIRNADRLEDLNFLIGQTLDSLEVCGYFAGPATSGGVYTIQCPSAITGRYVKLLKLTSTSALTLCEVEVMGTWVATPEPEEPFPRSSVIYKQSPGQLGQSGSSTQIQVQSRLRCASLCIQYQNCVGFNALQSETHVMCSLLPSSFTQTGTGDTSIKLYIQE